MPASSLRTARRLAASRRRYATQAEPKKRRRFRTFALTSVVLAAGAYGGGIYAATKNERFKDFFTETIPFGRQVVDYLDDASLRELGAAAGQVGPSKQAEDSLRLSRERAAKAAEAARAKREAAAQEAAAKLKRAKIEAETKAREEAEALKQKAIAAKEAAAEKAAAAKETASKEVAAVQAKAGEVKEHVIAVSQQVAEKISKATEAVLEGANAVATESSVSAVPPSSESKKVWKDPVPLGFEVPSDYDYKPPAQRKLISPQEKAALLPPPLPLVAPTVSELATTEPVLGELASTIDSLAGFLKDNPDNLYRTDNVKQVLTVAEKDLKVLGDRLHAIKGEEHKKLEASLEAQQKEYQVQLSAKEQELLNRLSTKEEDWRSNFETEREALRQDYRSKLEAELAVQKELINERLKEELVAQGIEMQRKWLRDIKVKVEEERGGRLAKLDQLSTDVQKLQQAAFASDAYLEESLKVNRLWSAIQAALGTEGKSLTNELLAVKELSASDSTADSTDDNTPLALATIAPETAEKGIATFPALSEWFASSLAPRIKQASLMPERGGCLAYFASAALSPFLFEKAGYVEGNDVVSVLSRAHYFLGRRDLDSAAREVNQLRGWPKILARDWLEAARRHLEVKQALSIVETEAKLKGLLVV